MIPNNPLILVDGSSYLYRAYHAYPESMGNGKIRTNAIYGVVTMLQSLRRQYPSDRMAVIFDTKGKTFREDRYPDYKANRPPMDQALVQQIEPLHQVIQAMGIPLIAVLGVEADDVIGTLARQATLADIPVLVSTGDKDMAQLVNPHVTLINTMTNEILTPEGVLNKFEISPERIIDYLALMGDAVDNIPGVPGIGEKSAKALIQHLGSLNEIYQRLDEVASVPFRGSKQASQKLIEYEEQARLSYWLATIQTDLNLDVGAQDIHIQPADNERLAQLYSELHFKSWLKALQGGTIGDTAKNSTTEGSSSMGRTTLTLAKAESDVVLPVYRIPTEKFVTILDSTTLADWAKRLQRAKLFVVDTQTNGLDYMQADLVGIAFAIDKGESAYIPIKHEYLGAPQQLSLEIVRDHLAGIFANPNIVKIGHNIKFDQHILQRHGLPLAGVLHDCMMESHTLNSVAGKHDVDSLALRLLKYSCTSFEDVTGKGKNQLTFDQIEFDVAARYAAEYASVIWFLHDALQRLLKHDPLLLQLYQHLELPFIKVLQKMEQIGVCVDIRTLQNLSHQFSEQLLQLEQHIFEQADCTFNLSSPKQLGHVLFEQLQLPVKQKTPSGVPSTNEEVLSELALDYPIVKAILEHRGLSKLKSTYTDPLPKLIQPVSQRIHTSYHPEGTATGRLSSSQPNLQNIPIRNEQGRAIRQAFIPQTGWRLISIDYSQIELRIMAHLSQDPALLRAFQQNLDIHQATAAEVNDIELSRVTAEERRKAKATNFGLIYGMGSFGLAKQLGIGNSEAKQYIDIYFQRYPGVLRYMNETRENAKENGYITTIMGRKLYLPEIHSSNAILRKGAERAAINAPMQGSAADIMKKAMIEVQHWIDVNLPNHVNLLMQVHDELILEISPEHCDEAVAQLKHIMEHIVPLSVPLVCNVGLGDNWGQAH